MKKKKRRRTFTHATILVQEGNGSADSIQILGLCINWKWVVSCVCQTLTSKKKKAPLARWTGDLIGPYSQSAQHAEEKNVCLCWNSSTLPQSSNQWPSNYTNYAIPAHASGSYQHVLFPEPAILKWVILMCHGLHFSPTYTLWNKKLLSCVSARKANFWI